MSVANTAPDFQNLGNNALLVADLKMRQVKRFLTGRKGCEITGVTGTPDGTTLFVQIQHPGETATEISDPAQPLAVSAWPDGAAAGRPRAATVVIRRIDGGRVGS